MGERHGEKPYDWRDERDASIAHVADREDFVDRIYFDDRNIPTLGYGQSLTDTEISLWSNLKDILNGFGVPESLHEKVGDGVTIRNNPAIEPSRLDGKYTKLPPFGVTVDRQKAREMLGGHMDQDEATLHRELGLDAAGVSNWEKLTPEMRIAVRDARYNAPGLVGAGLKGVLKNQGDPAWQDKAWWELAVNVKNPNARRLEEANSFTMNSMLRSPVPNLFNTKSYRDDIYSAAGAELNRAMQPGPKRETPEPEVRLWDSARDAAPTPGNLLNSNALPENLLNMPDYEMRKWGLR